MQFTGESSMSNMHKASGSLPSTKAGVSHCSEREGKERKGKEGKKEKKGIRKGKGKGKKRKEERQGGRNPHAIFLLCSRGGKLCV